MGDLMNMGIGIHATNVYMQQKYGDVYIDTWLYGYMDIWDWTDPGY